MQALYQPQPLYLPAHPVSWAVDRLDTAVTDIRRASVTGWRSALADRYREELDDLARDVAHARDLALAAERAYVHLGYVARMNGE